MVPGFPGDPSDPMDVNIPRVPGVSTDDMDVPQEGGHLNMYTETSTLRHVSNVFNLEATFSEKRKTIFIFCIFFF